MGRDVARRRAQAGDLQQPRWPACARGPGRAATARGAGLLVVRAHSFSFGVPSGLFDVDELAHGLHGGAVETSLVMHLRPELVRQDALADFPSTGRTLQRTAACWAWKKRWASAG